MLEEALDEDAVAEDVVAGHVTAVKDAVVGDVAAEDEPEDVAVAAEVTGPASVALGSLDELGPVAVNAVLVPDPWSR